MNFNYISKGIIHLNPWESSIKLIGQYILALMYGVLFRKY